MEAADRYVEYRYLHSGIFRNYKKCKELEGDTGIHRYYRVWFRKFDKALGFPRPPVGDQATPLANIEMAPPNLLYRSELCSSIHQCCQ